jgi:predicted nuclease of predicted toxin-antitoxin system
MRLYLDEDAMDDDLVHALHARGVDVETVYGAGMVEREDEEQLTYATLQERVLYTFNIGHFRALHASFLSTGKRHAGIVVCQQKHYAIREQLRRLLSLIAANTAEEMQNRLEFLSNWPPL